MYARHLATCCLLFVSLASGASLPDAGKDVVVYLKPAEGLSASALEEAKNELTFVMRGVGMQVAWWDAERTQSSAAETLIVADFTGTCSAPMSAAVADVRSLPPLAHTSTANGRILPLTYVDCSTVSQLLGPALTRLPIVRREQLYGRAIGRLLAHEIYHILAQTRDHAAAGIAKEHFSSSDLLATRFEFESATTAHMAAAPPHGWTLVGF